MKMDLNNKKVYKMKIGASFVALSLLKSLCSLRASHSEAWSKIQWE